MADIPNEFLEGWEEGHFPAYSARDWGKDHPEEWREIREYMDEGLSMEWAFAALDKDMPGPDEWDSMVVSRDADGSWDVTITTDSGETFTIDAAANDDMAADNIFSDLLWGLVDEYDIDVQRDIDYSED